MPPKKKCTPKTRKGELLFTEPRKEGPVYCYGSPLQSAGNPRCVPTKPVNQIAVSWITPQFESGASLGFQRWHHKSQNIKNKDTSHVFPRMRGRRLKPTACKFLPLTFEKVRTNPCAVEGGILKPDCGGQTENCAEMCDKQPNGSAAISPIGPTTSSRGACVQKVCHSPSPHCADPAAFSPPDICTPEMSSVGDHNWGCLPQMDSFTPGLCNSLVFGEATSLLAEDTPEHEYGVKVTWRRRSRLMKYLREKGVLSTSDILVKTQMSELPGEARERW